MPTTTGKRGIAGAVAVVALFAAGLFIALEHEAGAETLATARVVPDSGTSSIHDSRKE